MTMLDAPQSELLGQTVITLHGIGDVLVMVFSDCVMYVRGEMVDGTYFNFNPEDWREMVVPVAPIDLMPLDSKQMRQLRTWLYCDYSAMLNSIN